MHYRFRLYGILANRTSFRQRLLGVSRVCRNSHGRIRGRPSPREQIFLGGGAVTGFPYKSVEDFRFLRDKVDGVYFAVHAPYRAEFDNLVAIYQNFDAATTAVVHVGI